MHRILVALAVTLAALGGYWAGSASRSAGTLGGSGGEGAVIARFARKALHASEVEARLRALPEMARARLTSAEARRTFVEDLVRERLLAHLAEEKGYQRDPEFARRYAEELGAFYLEKEFEEPERRKAPTEDEVRKYFEEHRAELSRPERVRIALIAFKPSSPSEHEGKRALARSALADVKARSRDYYGFGNVARARSEDARTRAAGGEVGYASREELAKAYGPELAQAAFGMKSPNEILPSVVESAGGFYLLKLLGREAAYEPRFEAVRDSLLARLSSQRHAADRKRFLDELWQRAEVKIDDQTVKGLAVEQPSARRP
jgi:parvulin-like peptidyl-prolyl isomerase